MTNIIAFLWHSGEQEHVVLWILKTLEEIEIISHPFLQFDKRKQLPLRGLLLGRHIYICTCTLPLILD